MARKATNDDRPHLPDVTFRFPDGHTWRYAGCEQAWMHEDPMGSEWRDWDICHDLMDSIGEPPLEEIPFDAVSAYNA